MEEPGGDETERYGMVIPIIVKPQPSQPVAVAVGEVGDITHNRYIKEEEHTGLQVAQVRGWNVRKIFFLLLKCNTYL